MRKTICVIICIVMMLFMLSCCAESIVVMDEYDILTPEEVLDGVQLDPDTMFAYRVLDDDTIMLVLFFAIPSCRKKIIITLLGYSIEEAYCRLELDFARVGSSRPDREKLTTDEGFNIRRGFFLY